MSRRKKPEPRHLARASGPPARTNLQPAHAAAGAFRGSGRIMLEPETIVARRRAKAHLIVFNEGHMPQTLTFGGHDPDRAVSFRFEPPTLVVAPGREGRSSLRVAAPRPRSGGETRRQLAVHAQGGPQPLMAWAVLVQRPLLSASARRILYSSLALAGALGSMASGLLPWTRGPVITGFGWTHARIAAHAAGVELPARLEFGAVAVPPAAASAGSAVVLLALFPFLGMLLRRPRWTLMSGLAMVVALALFAVALLPGGARLTPGEGLIAATVAASCTMLGGALSGR